MAQPAQQQDRFTYADYCSWPEGERWELIDGEAFSMAPAPSTAHQDVVGELFVQIKNQLSDSPCRAFVAPFDVRLPLRDETDEHTDTVVQPDISVICSPDRIDNKGCHGAPDWIIEVLSPRTAAMDQIRKRALYERHGVKEYWLVHPTDRLLFVYVLEGAGYGAPTIQATNETTAVDCLPMMEIDWEKMFPETADD